MLNYWPGGKRYSGEDQVETSETAPTIKTANKEKLYPGSRGITEIHATITDPKDIGVLVITIISSFKSSA